MSDKQGPDDVKIWAESIPDQRGSMCKGPEVSTSLVCPKVSKETSGAGREGSREEHRGRDRTVSRAQRQQGELGLGGEGAPLQSLKGTRRLRGP